MLQCIENIEHLSVLAMRAWLRGILFSIVIAVLLEAEGSRIKKPGHLRDVSIEALHILIAG